MGRDAVERHPIFWLAVLIVIGASPAAATPQDRDTGVRGAGDGKNALVVTEAREAAALAFVKKNQPELAQLLVYLKQKAPHQYERAVRELFRTSERLAQVRERDSGRYDLELRTWKTQSLVTLLVARWKMRPNERLRRELEKTIDEQFSLLREQLVSDRQRVIQRLKRLDAQIQKLDQARVEEVKRRFKKLTTARRPGSAKTPKEPATNKNLLGGPAERGPRSKSRTPDSQPKKTGSQEKGPGTSKGL